LGTAGEIEDAQAQMAQAQALVRVVVGPGGIRPAMAQTPHHGLEVSGVSLADESANAAHGVSPFLEPRFSRGAASGW
jgi:hypothetical protein